MRNGLGDAMEIILSIMVLLLQIVFGVLFGAASVYLSLKLFDKMTGNIDEMKELKRGNVAVAIVLVSLMGSIGLILSSGMNQFGEVFASVFESKYSFPLFIVTLFLAIIELIVVVLISVFVIYSGIMVIDKLTVEIDEMKELKRGNIAVAMEIGVVILVISMMVAGAIQGIEKLPLFDPLSYVSILGL